MNFFFYGTLLDSDIRRMVFGREAPDVQARPAALRGHVVRRARGADYPLLVAMQGRSASGIVLSGVSGREARRLDAYEGKDYRRVVRIVVDSNGDQIAAEVYLPRPYVRADSRPWSFEDWRRHEKKRFLRRHAARFP
jgi:hypothetical protein